MNKESVINERLKRQQLLQPLNDSRNKQAYLRLFRLLQPVAPVFNSRPGDPPKLVHRTTFDDSLISERLREQHKLVKGRFQGGRVGYVLEEDLNLYAGIFRKPLKKMTPLHEEILTTIQNSGGISKDQLKEELPYLAKEITAALKRLQEAYLVYEDQIDTDWNTGWFHFETEWFEIKLTKGLEAAVSEMLLNFLEACVFATLDQIKSWSQLKINTIQMVLNQLVEEKRIVRMTIDGLGEGFIQSKDTDLEYMEIPLTVFMLDKSDFLVRVYLNELKETYKGQEVLQYLLIDGEFKGAVLGHWRIGPHDIEDVKLLLTQDEAMCRKEDIINAIREGYSSDTTDILRFNGQNI
ncbi:MAG TPA: hypothetical protein VFK33_02970 [Bacillales bacterium]|nr:hypothetical protein [Bacillales bacterium]